MSYFSSYKWPYCFRLSGIFFKTFHEAYTIFLSGQRIGSHIGNVLWNIQHILWLISSFKQRNVEAKFWSVFKVGKQVSIIFSIHRFFTTEVLNIFPRLSYRLTFIMLNVGMVDNLEFCYTIFEFRGPKHVRFPLPGFSQSCVLLFFALVRAFSFFLFKAKTTLLVLWIFTSYISPHFGEFAGMKLKVISAR